jgi:hypothetical protein
MSKLQTPKQKGTRSFLRVARLLVAGVGLVFFIVGMASRVLLRSAAEAATTPLVEQARVREAELTRPIPGSTK